MNVLIEIDTTRYSTVINAILKQYPQAIVKINGKQEERNIDQWCTNNNLCNIRDFSISVDGEEIIFFHDHPRELFAIKRCLPLIQQLAEQKLLRFKEMEQSKEVGLLKGLFKKKT